MRCSILVFGVFASTFGAQACGSDSSPPRVVPGDGAPWWALGPDASAIDADASAPRTDAAAAVPGLLGATLPHLTKSSAIAYAAARDLVFDTSGSVVLAGSYDSPMTGFDSPKILRITKASLDRIDFTKTFAIGHLGAFGGLLAAEDGIYVAGSFSGHLEVDGHALDSVVNPGSGPMNGLDQHGLPSADVFLLKLSPSGSVSWLRSFGGVADQLCTKLLRAADGSLLMVGRFTGRMALGSYTITSSGGSTREDYFVATLDAAGEPQSVRQGPAFGFVSDAVVDSRNNLIFGGFQGGSIPVGGNDTPLGHGWIAAQDPTGKWLWASSLGPEQSAPLVTSLTVDSQDNLIAGADGYESPTLYGKPLDNAAAIVVKLDPQGNVLFARSYGTDYLDGVLGVATGSGDSILLTGIFYGSIDFGGGNLTALLQPPAIDGDIFLAELDANGAHRWSLSAGGEDLDAGELIVASGRRIVSLGYFAKAVDFGLGRLDRVEGGEYLLWLDDP